MGADGWIIFYDYEKFIDVLNKVDIKVKERIISNIDYYTVEIGGKRVVVRYVEYGTNYEDIRDWLSVVLEMYSIHGGVVDDMTFSELEKLIKNAEIGRICVWT